MTTAPIITRYRHGKPAAVSFTFDDGSQSQADIAAPLFAEHGWRATIYTVAGPTRDRRADPRQSPRPDIAAVSWEEWRALVDDGFEVGSHSWSHPRLNEITDAGTLEQEIVASGRLIQEKTGQRSLTFAFPYNVWNPAALNLARRTYAGVREQWSDYSRPGHTLEEANARVGRVITKGNWLIPCLHGIEEGYGPVSREFLRDHLAFIKEREADIWVDTFSNISRYAQERAHTTMVVVGDDKNSPRLRLACDLPAEVYDVPLTVQLESVPGAEAWRCGSGQPERLQSNYRDGHIFFDAPPGSEVEIRCVSVPS